MRQLTWMRYVLGLMLGLGLAGAACQPPTARKNSQVQVARQFLLALLRNNQTAAYPLLAADLHTKISLPEFERQTQPIAKAATRRGTDIELYKLGARLPTDAGQQTEYFVAFAWAADSTSVRRLPAEWLEVTFQDTASRQVAGFQLRGRQ